MRCTHCGMPLSPTLTQNQCPRCGAPNVHTGGKVRLTRAASQAPHAIFPPLEVPPVIQDAQSWSTPSSSSSTPPTPSPLSTYSEEQLFFPGQKNDDYIPPVHSEPLQGPVQQLQPYSSDSTASATPEQFATIDALPQNNPTFIPTTPAPEADNSVPWDQQVYYVHRTPTSTPVAKAPQTSSTSMTRTNSDGNASEIEAPRTKLGFTLAAACMSLGAFILIFVYILSQSLMPPAPLTTQSSTVSAVPNAAAQAATAQATQPLTPTALVATATSVASAQQYIDNVQLASGVNTTTGTPLDQRTSFRLGQPVYVTLTVHTLAYNGAVCLTWTVNNQAIPYATTVGSSTLGQTNAYFFFKPEATGNGSVDVAWSATTACANTVQIQQADFQVLP
jgi:hypothetical protein